MPEKRLRWLEVSRACQLCEPPSEAPGAEPVHRQRRAKRAAAAQIFSAVFRRKLLGHFPHCGAARHLTLRWRGTQCDGVEQSLGVGVSGVSCSTTGVRMEFVVIPRRRSYWVEEVQDGGERRVIARYPSENDALERLRHLRDKEQARELRRTAVEMSRLHMSAQG
jgi:hypothetical protein